jgi:hypothetical protein
MSLPTREEARQALTPIAAVGPMKYLPPAEATKDVIVQAYADGRLVAKTEPNYEALVDRLIEIAAQFKAERIRDHTTYQSTTGNYGGATEEDTPQ